MNKGDTQIMNLDELKACADSEEFTALENSRKFFETMSSGEITESMGGNAGPNRFAVNFYYNPKTGEIEYYGNTIPSEDSQLRIGALKFRVGLRKGENYLKKMYLYNDTSKLNPEVVRIMNRTKEVIGEEYLRKHEGLK